MSQKNGKKARSFAELFDIEERKEILKKYLYFLAWVEVLIFVGCWIYQLGSETYDRTGIAVDIPFPWKAYFTISFLAPLAITFIIGTIIVGFNRYLGDVAAEAGSVADFLGRSGETTGETETGSDRIKKLYRIVRWFQHVPFLGLLLLLGIGVGIFYKMDSILALIGHFGQESLKTLLIIVLAVIGIISMFVMVLIFLNYRLRKRSMEYQYRSEIAERFGLIILEDNTVIDKEGKLLVQGKKWKKALPRFQDVDKKQQQEENKALPYTATPSHASNE
ncbi:MAG: hypothetical protein JRI45_10775 [Deltaproteobacteria bacterium]|nr:hypothetical protein [Deltaproteobacteria bacterium]MBW2068167.1 hypothetical protein [Deltaproteobacteria bacterium]